MKKVSKKAINSIIIALTSIIYFSLAYVGYEKQNIDLNKYSQYEGVIIDKGIGILKGSKGRTSNVFYVTLNGLDERLGIYRMSKKYNDLLSNLTVGEKIKVYYKPQSNKNNINIDLIQIEKGGKIIVGKDEYERKESALIYLGLIGGIFTLIFAYITWKYPKQKKK